MRSDEVRALGELVGEAATGVAAQARDVHAGVAQRVFAALGPLAAPVRVLHDAIAAASYGAAGRLTGAIVRGGALGVALTRPADAPSLERDPRGRAVLGVLNGAWGDRLEQRGSVLATPLTVICDRAAAPSPTPRLVVFVHGLGETDASWRWGAARHRPYGDRLAAEHGFTPLYVRYNSGRPVSDNGAALSAALTETIADWPVAVQEIVLIGHSMGGLVIRAACGQPSGWSDRVRCIVGLGTPHTGAPLARAAHGAERALARLPETRAFAAPLRAGSAGIRDLRRGSELPFLESADHYFISATLTREPDALGGRLLGDLLVLSSSARAQRTSAEELGFAQENYHHLGAVNHFDLLNHPAVYAQLDRWVRGQRP